MIYEYQAKYNVNINTGSSKRLISEDDSEPNIEEQAVLQRLTLYLYDVQFTFMMAPII
jgi:hypothetical protein